MHAHRVKVFDGAHDDAVVVLVTNDFHLELFPAQQRFFNQQLTRGREIQTAIADLDKFFDVVGNPASRTTHRERRADDRREADLGLHRHGFFETVGDAGTGRLKTDLLHCQLEFLTVFGLVDGIRTRTNHLDLVLVEYAVMPQIKRTVQRSLSAHGRQHGIRTFLLDDAFEHLPGDRLDVGDIGHVRVGHDGRRIAVDQNDLVTLITQRLAGLGA